MKKIISLILTVFLICAVFCGCGSTEKDESVSTTSSSEHDYELTESASMTSASEDDYELTDPANPVATITMDDGSVMLIELFYDTAPNTVKNFIALADSGFYDGLIFHRVIPGFMIQGGDPAGNGTGGPGYNIVGEFSNNGIENDKSHLRGYVSMARRGNPYDPESCYNTAGSQFFIVVDDSAASSLDGDYAVFGYCFEGMDVADSIVSQKRDANDKPLKDQVIKSVRVDTGDTVFEEPETIL